MQASLASFCPGPGEGFGMGQVAGMGMGRGAGGGTAPKEMPATPPAK